MLLCCKPRARDCKVDSGAVVMSCRVPLIVHELLDVPTSNAAQQSAQQTHTMLLAAVPYVAGVATHVVNALHSHRVHERRWVVQ
jgi:hypothetical protein